MNAGWFMLEGIQKINEEAANPGLLDQDTEQAIFIHSLDKSKKIKNF